MSDETLRAALRRQIEKWDEYGYYIEKEDYDALYTALIETEAAAPAAAGLDDDLLDLAAQVRGGIDSDPLLNRRDNDAAHQALSAILARLAQEAER